MESKMSNKKRELKVKPFEYQPSKAELEEEIHIPTTPENLLRAVVRDVKVVHEETTKKRK